MSFKINEKSHLDVSLSELLKIDANISCEELSMQMNNILKEKIYGIGFSAYLDGQDPKEKSEITEQQIRERLEIIKPYTKWIRIFSCSCGHENIPRIAHEMGIKTLVGAWIGKDCDENEKEIINLIRIAKEGYADVVAVGNEVLYREDLTDDELICYIKRVKKELPNISVGYVDSYYLFRDHPKVTDECDVIFANCYPFWEYCSLENSIDYMKCMYKIALEAGKGKKVIISETGWPSNGTNLGGAVPSFKNAMSYFVHTYKWANEENVEIFYFTSFDEEWKAGHEGECGSYWGLWDKNGNFKYKL